MNSVIPTAPDTMSHRKSFSWIPVLHTHMSLIQTESVQQRGGVGADKFNYIKRELIIAPGLRILTKIYQSEIQKLIDGED